MSYSYTFSETTTFTATHAKHISAKVATDLKRMQRLYGSPCDSDIADYETEVIELLKGEYLGTVTYGFKRGEKWIEPTLQYTAADLAGDFTIDDDPGRIPPGADISGAFFYSYLIYSLAWDSLSEDEKDDIRKQLPVKRSGASEPGISGYLSSDRTYSAGGRAIYRSSVRKY